MSPPPQNPQTPKLLPSTFYSRSPEIVARALLGKLLIRDLHGERLTGRITEVEAYLGLTDPASHAYRGLTPNNFPLFGPPGRTHVYFIYGMYYCLNASAHLPGAAGGVLIRAIAPIDGIETMALLRRASPTAKLKLLTGGPGRLCQALDITRKNSNDLDLTSHDSPIQIADDGHTPTDIQTTPRIGLSKAADLPLRFLISEVAKVGRSKSHP
ncbi:DNA-3-methyladenine glycosylase [Granulicella sp. L60]|uniref:DNA-3-methyladenine glycosylase n=1 Tax=Granulicella sp. L60 TaxID=1641866 RepID=UPI00131E4592|nr:DNA-3-methyladenine glycosylase [Granulicella sp. L60]